MSTSARAARHCSGVIFQHFMLTGDSIKIYQQKLLSATLEVSVVHETTFSGPLTENASLLEAGCNADDAEVLALRAEFEHLTASRKPLADVADDLGAIFDRMVSEKGFEAARRWGESVNLDPMLEALEGLDERVDRIAEQMIALRPRTKSGIAALAATLKEGALRDYWDEPYIDPDWNKVLVMRFLDVLIANSPILIGCRSP